MEALERVQDESLSHLFLLDLEISSPTVRTAIRDLIDLLIAEQHDIDRARQTGQSALLEYVQDSRFLYFRVSNDLVELQKSARTLLPPGEELMAATQQIRQPEQNAG